MTLAQIKRRWRALFHKDELESELDAELRFHLEHDAAQNLQDGMNAEDAHYAALKSFGGVEQAKEECRDARGARLIEELWQDLSYGARNLRKHPGFSLIAILTLALGVGANTAIFSVVNATLLRPLPYQKPDQIVMVWGTDPRGFGWRGKIGLSAPGFRDYQQQNQSFERMATFNSVDFTLVGTDNPEPIRGGTVTPEFFDVLAVQPILGRAFLAEDAQAGRDHVVMLNYGLWQRRFGSDQHIVGRTINLDATPYTVIGVLPQGFDFSIPEYFESRDLWVPAVLPQDNASSERGHRYLTVIARLKPGVTLPLAQQDLGIITERLARAYPAAITGFGVKLVPLHEQLVGDIRRVLLLLFGAVGFVLLIACANVANLQLARASTRQKEIAIRRALGASRARVLRQLLTESMLLAVIGGTLGLLLALWGINLLVKLGPAGIPRGAIVTVDFTVLGYCLVVSLFTGILFGLAPALQSAPGRLSDPLKVGGRNTASREGGMRLRRLLTVCEVALSLILLIGAGLLIRSFAGLLQVNPGFESRNILTVRFDLPKYSWPEPSKQSAFYAEVLERVRALPGVTAAGVTAELPPKMGRHSSSFSIQGRAPIDEPDQSLAVQDRLVSSDYFRAMGIRLISGRAFSDTDVGSAPPVALINQDFARRFFPGENPIGQHLRFGSANQWITIVGIVGDVRGSGLDKQPSSEIYLAYQQQSLLHYNPLANMHLVVRTAGDPNALAAAVLGSVREVDKNLPAPRVRTMETVLAASIAERRSNMLLLGAFAVIALVLTGVGIYGVISYSVAQRTQEIGVRIALGAQSSDVMMLVLRSGMSLVLMGIVIGLAGSFALTRWLASLLFEISATDSLTFISTALLLTLIALLACWVPARRATKVDPLIALKYE